MSTIAADIAPKRSRPLYSDLSLQVLVAMLLGALVGYVWPGSADSLSRSAISSSGSCG